MAPPPWASKTRPVQSNYPAFQQQQQQDVVLDPTGMSTNVQRKQSIPSEVLVQAGVRSSVPKLNNLPSQFLPQQQQQQFYNPDYQPQQQYFPQQHHQPSQFFPQSQQPYLSQDFPQSQMNTVGHPQAHQQKVSPKPMQNGSAVYQQQQQQMQRPGPPAASKPRPGGGGHHQVTNVYQPTVQTTEGGSGQAGFPFLKIAGAAVYQQPEQQTSPKKRRWTMDKLRATDAIIPLQSGTNQFSSQRGMTGFGTPRDVRGKHVHRLWEEEYPEYIVDYYSQQ